MAVRLGLEVKPDLNQFAAELLAEAYKRWGAELPLHVDGEFALAVHDEHKKKLVLMHDELGLTHVYHGRIGDVTWFSTSLPEIVDRQSGLEIDEEYVADFLANREHFGRRTAYRAISRLLPGESLVVEGQPKSVRFWSLGQVAPIHLGSDSAYEECFRELITRAVGDALPVAGSTLCELSGGLDSSTIFCQASEIGAAPDAMSWVFPYSSHADERGAIEAVLKERPGRWFPVDADSCPPFSTFPKRWYAEPSPWLLIESWDQLYRELLATENVGVVLSGEGGDAVLMGDQQEPYFFADLLRSGRLIELARELRRWGRTTNTRRSASYLLMANALRPGWCSLTGKTLEHVPVPVPWLEEDYASTMRMSKRGLRSTGWNGGSVQQTQSLQRVRRSAQIVANYNRHRGDCAEFRHPLLSRPLLRFMLGTPPSRKMSPLRDRDLQRRALRMLLPAATLARSDKGGGDQPYYVGLERGAEMFERLTERPRVAERGYVNAARWQQALDQAALGRCVALKCVQATASVEIWLQQMEDRSRAPLDPLATAAR